jgi:glycosyltransferase involved in cell wall biosynthesis
VPYPLTMLARAELFERLGGFDATYQPGEDLEWLLRAKDAGVRYDLIPHVVVYKRVHSGSVSNRMAEVRVSMLRLLRSSVARKRARPLVSVVIPAFNAERFLGETIESVLAQDYEPIEIVVVDDGSTDGTSEVAGSYGVRCLRTQNGGQAAARNAGVAAARGELVAFVDADDLWEPGKLSRQVGHLIAHPELGYLMSRMQRTLMPGAPWPPGTPREWFSTPQPGTLSSAGLVRRSVLEAVGEFDSGYRHGCDTDWTVRATDAGVRWEMLPDVEVQYRIHGANDSYDNMGMKDEMFKTLRSSLARKRASESTR